MFLPFVYQDGQTSINIESEEKKYVSNNAWDFPFYVIYKEGSTFYRVDKKIEGNTNQMAFTNSSLEVFSWFLKLQQEVSDNKMISNMVNMHPNAFVEQAKVFSNNDSVWVIAPADGVLYLIDTLKLHNQEIAKDLLHQIYKNSRVIQKVVY